ncbi:MAG: AMP-binding protein [Paracoccaceae bacterium]
MSISDRQPLNGISHVKGRRDAPLIELTIPALLAQTVATHGNRPAAVFCEQDIRWSYADFAAEVDRLAAALVRLGFVKNDRIGIWSPNRAEWLLTQFATARIGAILVNINPAYRPFELEYALNKVSCKGLIAATAFKASNYIEMLQSLAPELIKATPGALDATRLPHLKTLVAMGDAAPAGMFSFAEIMQMGDDTSMLDAITASLDRNDPINIQFTSGTTGQPKGACLTHRNIVNNAHFVTAAMELTQADRLCIPVPFYHCFGMVMGTLGCVTKGAAMVVPSEGFEPAKTLRAVSDEKCTALFGVPTMFVAELALPDFGTYDLSHLRTGIMAGSPCPIQVMKDVQSKMNMSQVTIAYGMTETSPVSFQSNVDDPVNRRVSSVGRIHPHVEVKIVGEDGTPTPVGEQGELMTRGYSVMQSYWDEPDLTAQSIDADGWMHTGDLATLDTEGYCNITGRVKDMICRGGENIYPREIEEFLYTHNAVSEVQVFGLPDDKFGEITCVWVTAKAGQTIDPDDIKDFCKGQIAHYKVPAHVRIKDSLPMTVTGKPQKFIMRDEMIKELGLSVQETA